MPTTYPTALDVFTSPTPDQLASPSVSAQAIKNLNDAMAAVQAQLGLTPGTRFHATVTLTSAAAATPVEIIADAIVGAGRKVYVEGYIGKVNGVTDWGTTATVKIQDTNGTPVDFATLTASALDGNEVHGPWSDSATIEAAMALGTGGTAGKGLQVAGNANGTGSDLVLTVWGVIR